MDFLTGIAIGFLLALVLVGLGFYWGVQGRTLISLFTPWLGRLQSAMVYLPRLLAILRPLLIKLKVLK